MNSELLILSVYHYLTSLSLLYLILLRLTRVLSPWQELVEKPPHRVRQKTFFCS